MKKTGHGKTLNSFFLSPFLLSLLFSCASLSLQSAPEELTPRWETFAPGIDYFAGRTGKPRLELWALRVDLCNPDLEFVVNGDGPEPIPSTTVTKFVKDYDCIAGINTTPFDPASAVIGEDRVISGITISGGIIVSAPQPRFDALVFYNDGSAAILSQADLDAEALETIHNAVGGFFIILQDGAIPERFQATRHGQPVRHPRSAAGLSADGKTLYLLAIDGRRSESVGATEKETGIILKRLGADDGLNFDGGGSTALVLRYPDGRIGPVNTPTHGRISGKERSVATCLGIRILNEP
ncbi:phosphodiester glycosidase family protein [Treponema primitia]|uniref:phosphodiester glycosidase family protein n=1 Tax=Treponema primitia TaxID=88058 RepID=UPI0039814D41